MIHVDQQLYQRVESYLERRYSMRVRRKDRSPFLRMLARGVLSGGDIVDVDQFMDDFATTIPLPLVGPVAFVPWDSQSPAPDGWWASRIATLGHEAQHVVQMGETKKRQRRFASGYAMSGEYRAEMEIEAYSLTLAVQAYTDERSSETLIWFPGSEWDAVAAEKAPRSVGRYLSALENYHLSAAQIAHAEKELRSAAERPGDVWKESAAGAALLAFLLTEARR